MSGFEPWYCRMNVAPETTTTPPLAKSVTLRTQYLFGIFLKEIFDSFFFTHIFDSFPRDNKNMVLSRVSKSEGRESALDDFHFFF